MPELPEVETIRAGLAPLVRGRTLAQVRVLHPRPVRRHAGGPADFQTSLVGRTFAIPARRGKYLWLPFDDGDVTLICTLLQESVGEFRDISCGGFVL